MKSVRIKIPGKIMLAGEYAVLRGGHALAVTLDRYMVIEAKESSTHYHWTIQSNLWDEPKIVADLRVQETDPLRKAVQTAAKKYNLFGGNLSVSSELQVESGIGSSSALRLGVMAAFEILKNGRSAHFPSGINRNCLSQAWTLQTEAQGQASGYDLVTQYVGGLVEFQPDYLERDWTPHWFRLPIENLSSFIHVFIGGKGAPTTQTLQTTSSWLEGGTRSERLLDISENLVDAFVAQIRFPDFSNMKKLINHIVAHRNLFAASPLFPADVAASLAAAPGHDQSWTWKTTGAGGEDAILLIGSLESIRPAHKTLLDIGWRRIDANFSDKGISIIDYLDPSKEVPHSIPMNPAAIPATGRFI